MHSLFRYWMSGHYHYSFISILSSKSAKCMHSAFKYRSGDQLLWIFLHSNIGFCVSLIYVSTSDILDEWLATRIILVFQYWFLSQPNACIQHSNTGWVISYSDYFCMSILVSLSAQSMHSLFRYWMSDCPIWLVLYSNTEYRVSQMHPLSI